MLPAILHCTTASHQPRQWQRVWSSVCDSGEGSSASQHAARISYRCRDRACLLTSFFHLLGLTASDSSCLLVRAPVNAVSCATISGLAALSLKARVNPFFSQFSMWKQHSAAVQICKAQLNIWIYPKPGASQPHSGDIPRFYMEAKQVCHF